MVLSDLRVHLDKTPETGDYRFEPGLFSQQSWRRKRLASDRRAFIHGSAHDHPATTGEPRSVRSHSPWSTKSWPNSTSCCCTSRSVVGMVSGISRHILAAGGKRIRPALLLMSARAAADKTVDAEAGGLHGAVAHRRSCDDVVDHPTRGVG